MFNSDGAFGSVGNYLTKIGITNNTVYVGSGQTIQSAIDSCANPAENNSYTVIVSPGHEDEIYTSVPHVFVSYEGFGSLHAIEPGAYGLHTTNANEQNGYFEHSLLPKGSRFYGGIIHLNGDISVTNVGSYETKWKFFLPGVFSSATLTPILGTLADLQISDAAQRMYIRWLVNEDMDSKLLLFTRAVVTQHRQYVELPMIDMPKGTGSDASIGCWQIELQAQVTGGTGTIHDSTSLLLIYEVI